jgi:peptidoglycan/xylan/chitin deacetylase (PgdA/CDA1 family)
VRYRNRHRLRLLMFHRFSSDRLRQWRAQCAHLRKFYTPISLSYAVSCMKSGIPFPSNSVVVTVDDGYRDFLTVAYPALSEFQIPAIVYLATDFLDRKDWLWWDKVDYLFRHTALPAVTFRLSSGEIRCQIDSPSLRTLATDTVLEALKQTPDAERLQFLSVLPELTETPLPVLPTAHYEPLNWNEVRRLAADGIEFGAHTVTHPILPRVSDERALCREIEGSRKRIEQELQSSVSHFSYPNGDWDSRAARLVASAAFDSAVTIELGLNNLSDNPLFLKRIALDTAVPELYFRHRTAGFRVGA